MPAASARSSLRLTAAQLRALASMVAAALLGGAGGYPAGTTAARPIETRFEKDSARRWMSDSLSHAQLQRIDERVSAIYCAQVPAAQRAGCR